jgi:hypothetical protein
MRKGIKPMDNTQELDLRKQNSSLLGIGFLAQSHTFGNYRYEYLPCKLEGNMSRIKEIDPLKFFYFGIESSFDEELRKFMIRNMKGNISIKHFINLFNKDPLIYFKEELDFFRNIGKLKIDGDFIKFNIVSDKEGEILNKVFFSQSIKKLFDKKYKADYDPSYDYDIILKRYLQD